MTSRKLTAEDTPRKGYTTSIEYQVTSTGPQASRIVVESETLPVTSTVFHEVPVTLLMRRDLAANPSVHISADTDPESLVKWVPKLGKAGKDIEREVVRRVYEKAAAEGRPPAQAVADALNVSLATAGRRIRDSKTRLGWG